jgi:hypothetical protein
MQYLLQLASGNIEVGLLLLLLLLLLLTCGSAFNMPLYKD